MSSDRQRVRELAYRLWEERGRPEGYAEQDWFAAERQLEGQAGRASRAADALPNRPPANVEVQLDAVNERGKKSGSASEARSV